MKIFVLGGTIFFVSLGIINFLLILVGAPFAKINKWIETSYYVLVHLIFILLHGFFGAYYVELINIYSNNYNKWFLIIISLAALLIWNEASKKSLRDERKRITDSIDLDEALKTRYESNVFNSFVYRNMITITGLKTSFFSFISFLIFLFFPSLINWLYDGLPRKFANLF